ncbi:hypothetical protein Y590_20545 [Methylobacterium sp. AMS5]|nr:hypothetical protein Y590_20545 [Methylobacterium sp. AMS5]
MPAAAGHAKTRPVLLDRELGSVIPARAFFGR